MIPAKAEIHFSAPASRPVMGPGFRRDDNKNSVDHDSSSFAWSRSAYFWTLPVEVFGKGPNTTAFGTL